MSGSNIQQKASIPEDVKKVLQKVVGNKQTIMSTALARIFTARSEGDWIYSNLQGVICIVWDREKENTPFLRLFDIETFDLLFEVEMYIDFHLRYTALTPCFYFFECMSAFIGLQFADDQEANLFSMKVMTQSLKSKQLEQEEDDASQQKEKKKQEKEGLFGFRQGAKKLFGNFFKKDSKSSKNEGKDSDNCQISKPISVKKETSLQFNYKTNQFDFSNLNEEWKTIFSRAGIQAADLSNQELAPIIFEHVLHFQQNYESNFDNNQSQRNSQADNKNNQQQRNPTNNQNNDIQNQQKASTNIPPTPSLNIPTAPQLNIPTAPQLNIPVPPPLNVSIPVAPQIQIPAAPSINIGTGSNQTQSGNISNQKSNIPAIPKNPNFDSSQVMNKSSLLDQIKAQNFNLKRVEVNQKDNKANLDVSQMDNKTQENLSLYLSKCIAERRKQIRKNYSSSEESNNSSDDD